MSLPYRDRPNALPWPPLVYTVAILIAWGLQRVDAFEAMDDALQALPRAVGFVVFAVGLAFDLWAITLLRRHGTTVMPNAASKTLVTDGPYAYSRNPIYVGNTVAMLGMAIALRWGWLLLLLPVTVAAVTWLAVSREEQHLESRFGDAWRAYAQRVRRWL